MRNVLRVVAWLCVAGCLNAAQTPPFVSGSGEKAHFRSFEDDAGGFYLIWVQRDDEKRMSLLAQHFNPEGGALWEMPGLLVTRRLASQEDWSGLADGRGGLTLFWDEADGVYSQRYLPDGTPRRSPSTMRISTSTALQPDAVADAVGGTLVVWRETLSGDRTVLKAQRMDNEGRRVWPPGGIRVSLRASHQSNPRIIDDGMSGMIIAWRDEGFESSELRVQRMDFQGNRLWTLEGLPVNSPMGKSEFPALAPLGAGSAVLSWMGQEKQTAQIFLQRVGPEPRVAWEKPVYASKGHAAYNCWDPVLVGDGRGGSWIGWEDFRNQVSYQVQVNHLHGQGASAWPKGEITVAPAQGDQGTLAMSRDAQNGVWLGWMDNRLSTVSIYVQHVSDRGERRRGPRGLLIADQLSKPSRPQLVPLSPSQAAVVWSDRPKKGEWSLFWKIIGAP